MPILSRKKRGERYVPLFTPRLQWITIMKVPFKRDRYRSKMIKEETWTIYTYLVLEPFLREIPDPF